jgi:hypothetical protein
MRSGRRSITSSETPPLNPRSIPLRSGGALLTLAWTNVALHAAGLALAWCGLRPGSAVVPLAERMAYLASRPSAWTWGWGIWMLCALVLVAFMAVLRRRLPGDPIAAQLALVFTAAGMAVDLLCDATQIQILPLAASAGPARPDVFLAFERLASTGGLTAANGLYTLGVLLMNLSLRGVAGTPARLAGWVSVVAGFALAAAGLIPLPLLLQTATGLTIGSYCLWTVLVARDLR